MPKPAKIILGLLVGYLGLIVAFELMIGILQPEQGQVLTITTTGDDDEVTTIAGSNFGPVNVQNTVAVHYQSATLDSVYAKSEFTAVSCAVTAADTAIECTSAEGVGLDVGHGVG